MKVECDEGSGVTINGTNYSGCNSISISNGVVTIDGVVQSGSKTGHKVEVTIIGNATRVETTSGNITVNGTVNRLDTVSGGVEANDIGSVETVSGDVNANLITGTVETVSGKIKYVQK